MAHDGAVYRRYKAHWLMWSPLEPWCTSITEGSSGSRLATGWLLVSRRRWTRGIRSLPSLPHGPSVAWHNETTILWRSDMGGRNFYHSFSEFIYATFWLSVHHGR